MKRLIHTFLLLYCIDLSAQSISGQINEVYIEVVSILNQNHNDVDSLIVTPSSGFIEGDTVLIYQAKCIGFKINNDTLYKDKDGYGGRFEFLRIKKVIGNTIVLNRNLSYNAFGSYDIQGKVQVIKVPRYYNATVSGSLTAPGWNGKTGGVIALIVENTLTLNSSIDIGKKGFRGGLATSSGLVTSDLCVSKNVPLYSIRYADSIVAKSYSGLKGEGIYTIPNSMTRGPAHVMNGGGGGIGLYSGGGGGGNIGAGGRGGDEASPCIPQNKMAEGGFYITVPIDSSKANTRAFMGGGGGAGVYLSSDLAHVSSKGANGGGVIIIVAEEIKGNGLISATGESNIGPVSGSGGGGGAGGSVFIDAGKISGTITVSVNGSVGISSIGCIESSGIGAAAGGGGGGGLVFLNKPFSNNILFNKTGGKYGNTSTSCINNTSQSGDTGTIKYNLKTPLLGLNFNSLPDSQVVCKGDSANTIVGSTPKYSKFPSYCWLKSYNKTIWDSVANGKDYHYDSLIKATTYFCRKVIIEGFSDTSNIHTVIAYTAISQNVITSNVPRVCQNDNSTITLKSSVNTIGGIPYLNYNYQWQYYNASWLNISVGTLETMIVNNPNDTTKYRRIITQNNFKCNNTSAPHTLFVLPKITRNKIGIGSKLTLTDTILCQPQIPGWLNGDATGPKGGNDSYSYQWVRSYNLQPYDSIINTSNYNCNILNTSARFRRIVSSSVCKDTSNTIYVTLLDSLSMVDFSDKLFCLGDTIRISISGGNGSYNNYWEHRNGGVWTTVDSLLLEHRIAIVDTGYMRVIVKSGLHDCCKDTSNIHPIQLHVLSKVKSISLNPKICIGDSMHVRMAFNGSKPYSIHYNEGLQTNLTKDSGIVVAYVPTTNTFQLTNVLDKNNCNVDTTGFSFRGFTLYPIPLPKIIADTAVCGLTTIIDVTNTYTTGSWSYGGSIKAMVTNNNLVAEDYGSLMLKYIESNGTCAGKDSLKIIFYQMPIATIIMNDTTMFYRLDKELVASDLSEGNGVWSVLEGSGIINDATNPNAKITNLAIGVNRVKWHVRNGVCQNNDSVSIFIKDLLVPDGFSPNGDAINPTFKILGIENASNSELMVFNNWGGVVYQTTNYKNDWDGTNNGNPLPEDSYYYVLKYGSIIKKGIVVIKR